MKKLPPLIWVLKTLRHRLNRLLFLLITEAGSSMLAVAFALGTKEVINSAVEGNVNSFYKACIVQALIILGLITTSFLSRSNRTHMEAELDRDWKKKLFDVLLHGQYKKVASYHTGELLNRLNNDVRILDDGLLNVLPGFFSMIVKVLCILFVMFTWDATLTFAIIAIGLLLLLGTGFVRKKIRNIHKRVSEAEGRVSGFLQETLGKLFVVQAMDISDEIKRRSDLLLKDRFTLQRKRKRLLLFANTFISVFTYGARFGGLIWGAIGIIRQTLSYGELTAMLQLLTQLMNPFVSASGILPKYIEMSAAAERLMELNQLSQEEKAGGLDIERLYRHMTELAGENLTFSYEQEPVLECSSFTIPKGSFTVITGSSGNGKSTLLKLMLGIYEPECGDVYIGTKDERIRLGRHTRSLFAYVPQGNLLFSGTLRENLLLTKPDASEEQLQEAIYISAMDQCIEQFPSGLETILGESGLGLSEGQAQRIAIARAVLTGARILLLDEATSSLDAETELTVLSRIKELKDRTCIAVTHRPAALKMADWQIRIEEKRIQAGPISCKMKADDDRRGHA